jgi:hypothetical protein
MGRVEGLWEGTDIEQIWVRSVRQAQELPRQGLPEIGSIAQDKSVQLALLQSLKRLSFLVKIIGSVAVKICGYRQSKRVFAVQRCCKTRPRAHLTWRLRSVLRVRTTGSLLVDRLFAHVKHRVP